MRWWGEILAWGGLLLTLSACAGGGGGGGGIPVRPAIPEGPPSALTPAAPGEAAAGSGTIALLIPQSGSEAGLGQAMLNAAKLALGEGAEREIRTFDTASSAEGAAKAAEAALADGARVLLGPVTAAETRAVIPVASRAGVPLLAFTSDPTLAAPGAWVLGLTPAQQVRRLVAAARNDGRQHFAAILPDDTFGHLMGQALEQSLREAGLEASGIHFHGSGMASLNALIREVSDYAHRRGPIDAEIRKAREAGDRKKAAELARSPIPPPPFDALLLADTGETLAEITSLLAYYDAGPPEVRLLGPALWARPAAHAGAALHGAAWYAAPDPATRSRFVSAYSGKYGANPPPLADLAYDAAALGHLYLREGRGALTAPEGYLGVDGPFALMPDGTVRRGLAVFDTAGHLVAPAPSRIGEAGS
jgi:branched-chain amino acid transport system substrate-binding protein